MQDEEVLKLKLEVNIIDNVFIVSINVYQNLCTKYLNLKQIMYKSNKGSRVKHISFTNQTFRLYVSSKSLKMELGKLPIWIRLWNFYCFHLQ